MNVYDESEISWADIDRALLMPSGYANRVWRRTKVAYGGDRDGASDLQSIVDTAILELGGECKGRKKGEKEKKKEKKRKKDKKNDKKKDEKNKERKEKKKKKKKERGVDEDELLLETIFTIFFFYKFGTIG